MAKTNNGVITLRMRELHRLKCAQAVVGGMLKPGIAARRLGLTDRQFRRVVVRYKAEGSVGLLSKLRGRPKGQSLPYKVYDRLTEVDQGAIVDNKRLGKVLEIAQLVQEKRDNSRSSSVHVLEGPPRKRGRPPGNEISASAEQKRPERGNSAPAGD